MAKNFSIRRTRQIKFYSDVSGFVPWFSDTHSIAIADTVVDVAVVPNTLIAHTFVVGCSGAERISKKRFKALAVGC